jgi:hypothetical protein
VRRQPTETLELRKLILRISKEWKGEREVVSLREAVDRAYVLEWLEWALERTEYKPPSKAWAICKALGHGTAWTFKWWCPGCWWLRLHRMKFVKHLSTDKEVVE